MREEIEHAFQCLSEREAEVLTLRYGMDCGGHARTLDEVGVLLNLTRERIRQIEKTALKRLKRSISLRETAGAPAVIGSPRVGASSPHSTSRCASPAS